MKNNKKFTKVGKRTGMLMIETFPMDGHQQFENLGIDMKVSGNYEHIAAALHQVFNKFPELAEKFKKLNELLFLITNIPTNAVKDVVKAAEELKEAGKLLEEKAKQESKGRAVKNRMSRGLKVVKGPKEVDTAE